MEGEGTACWGQVTALFAARTDFGPLRDFLVGPRRRPGFAVSKIAYILIGNEAGLNFSPCSGRDSIRRKLASVPRTIGQRGRNWIPSGGMERLLGEEHPMEN
jgi:hypothetical protein